MCVKKIAINQSFIYFSSKGAMGKFSIADLVDHFLFYFSFFNGIFKRRKMDKSHYCDVFAGEEEVTPRSMSPVQLQQLPQADPPLPEIGIIGVPDAPPENAMFQPEDNIVPWCPVPHRRSNRRRVAPAMYSTSAAVSARKSRKRMKNKRMTGMKKSAKAMHKRPARRASPARNSTSSKGAPAASHSSHHSPAATHSSPPSTPKASRITSRRKPVQTATRRRSSSIQIPKTFVVTIQRKED